MKMQKRRMKNEDLKIIGRTGMMEKEG